MGIEKTLACISGLRALAIDAAELSKSGSFITKLPKILLLMPAIYSLVKQASEVLPEIDDLDDNEVKEIFNVGYTGLRDFVKALSA